MPEINMHRQFLLKKTIQKVNYFGARITTMRWHIFEFIKNYSEVRYEENLSKITPVTDIYAKGAEMYLLLLSGIQCYFLWIDW